MNTTHETKPGTEQVSGVDLATALPEPPPLDHLAQTVFAVFGEILTLPGLAMSAECGLAMIVGRELSGRLVYQCRPPGRIRWRRTCGQHRVEALSADRAAWQAYGTGLAWWPLTLVDSRRAPVMYKRAILASTVSKVCLRTEDGLVVAAVHTTGRRKSRCFAHHTA